MSFTKIHDDQSKFAKIVHDIQYVPVFDPYGPVKFDPYNPLFNELPLILATQHQFAGHLAAGQAQTNSRETYRAMIQQAENQMSMLKAHIENLNRQMEQLDQAEKG